VYIVAKLLYSDMKSRYVVGVIVMLRVNVDLISVGVGRIDGLAGLYEVV
jgi:hypothetical protein